MEICKWKILLQLWTMVKLSELNSIEAYHKQEPKFQSAFNPNNPFVYRVPYVISYVVNNPLIKNKTNVEANMPYNSSLPVEKIGDYYYYRAIKCGVHFLNPFEGFIISDKMFGNETKPPRCTWGFVGSQFCTPSIQCPQFKTRTRNSDCRMNYLQITDSGESFVQHFCDSKHSPDPKHEFIAANGVLDVTFRYQSISKRPEFECHVKCIHYPVNFTTSIGPDNKTVVHIQPATNGVVEENLPKPRVLSDCKCGVPNNFTRPPIETTTETQEIVRNSSRRINRIVGGRETSVGQYPWMVGLVHAGKVLPFCGASLISDRYVLTAAHCLEDEEIDDFAVILNEHDFLDSNETVGSTIVRRVIEHIPFPYYMESTFYGDLALLLLETPIDISNFTTTPVCLPLPKDMNNTYIDYEAIGSGWGTLFENGKKSQKLYEVILRVFSNAACNDYHTSTKSEPLQVTDNMMCAGFHEGGRDTCSGDSGGPLVAYDDNRFKQIGVTSWGFGCGNARNPGIFSRVTSFLYWIRLHTVDSIWCQP